MLKLLPNENLGETIRLRKDAVIYLLNQTVHPKGEVTKVHERPSVGNQSFLSCQVGGIRNGGKRQKLVLAAWAELTGNVSEPVQCCFKSPQRGNGDRTTLLSHRN